MHQRILALLFITGLILSWSGAAPAVADEKATDKGVASAPLSPNEERLYQLFERQLNTLTLIITGIVGGLAIVQVLLAWSEHRRQASLRKTTDDFIKQNAVQAEANATLMRQFMDQNTRQTEGMVTQTRDLINQSVRQAEQVATQMATQARDFMERTTRQTAENMTHTNLIMQRIAELIASMTHVTDLSAKGQKLAEKIEKDQKVAKQEKRLALRELADSVRPLAEGKDTRFDKSRHYLLKSAADAVAQIRYTHRVRDGELPASAHLVNGYRHSVIDGNYRDGAEEFGKVISSSKASAKQREIALYNRGIDRANLRQYALAIKDFEEALALNEANLFYCFYRLDTALLKARQEGGATDGLAGEFESLVVLIRQADDLLCEPLNRKQLLTRALLSYASLLIFKDPHDCDKALQILEDPNLEKELFARSLALTAQQKAHPETPLDTAAVAACLAMAKTGYSAAIEPRSRLLRGMILQRCYRLTSADHKTELNALHGQLQADIAALEKQGGDTVTVFSPLTQKNELLRDIRKQIG